MNWSTAELAEHYRKAGNPEALKTACGDGVEPSPRLLREDVGRPSSPGAEIPGFVISGAIRSKKTSQKIISIPKKGAKRCPVCKKADGFPKLLPSDAHAAWHKDAMEQCLSIKSQLARRGVSLPIKDFVSVRALFYQDVDRADATGLYESLADLLQDAQILENDRLIADWDLSRRLKDAARPRVEVFLKIVSVRPVEGNLFAEEEP